MSEHALQLKFDLLQKVLNLDSERLIAKLLRLIEKEEGSITPEKQQYYVDRVMKAQDDISKGRVRSHDEVKQWIEAKKISARNGN